MKYLSHYTEDRQTQLFQDTGAFFAFDQKQFDEAMKYRNKNCKWVSLGSGLIAPKNMVNTILKGLKKIQQEGIQQDLKENGKQKVIERELFNHECFYTGDYQDCVEALKDYGITKEEIKAEFNRLYPTVEL